MTTGNISGSAPWRLELFGGLRLSYQGENIEKFSTRKTAGVLAYLACHRGKAISRDTLADVFWPENDPESARNSLRVALNALRKLLSTNDTAEVLKADRLSVRLEPAAFATDINEFEAALRDEARAANLPDKVAAVMRAISLYRGPFLEGWYEEWVDGEQNRFGEIYRNALRRITSYLIESREYESALEFAQRAVQADPLREESHRLIIRLHMVMSNPGAAMQQYRDLERILRKELGALPSGATRELLRQTPPSPVDTGIVVAPSASPAKQGAVAIGSVPTLLTPFFGREDELAEMVEVLTVRTEQNGCRLITLTGMGGTGKSRLAIEVSSKVQASFPGGAWFVSLVGLTNIVQVTAAITTCLRLTPNPDIAPGEQIIQALGVKRALLILDNFEQLIDSATAWVTTLLERVPTLVCLVTSRYRLDVSLEQEVPIAPLPAPTYAEAETAPIDRLSSIASVALFVDRARTGRPDFRLNPQNAPYVAAICSALDGLPLAIELAAAWIRLLTPAEIRNRLRERFDLLITTHRDVPERHRSLRAVLEGSYHLITEDDKVFFARLSVFRGGWDLIAAEEITGETTALARLNLLQQRSLVLSQTTANLYRFRMLESVSEFAASHLSPEDSIHYRRRHAAYFLGLAESAAHYLHTPSAESWLSLLDCEEENLRAALEFLFSDDGDSLDAARLTGALWRFWYARGHSEEGVVWLERALRQESDTIPVVLRISLREGMGRLATSMGRNTMAIRFLRQALDQALPTMPEQIASLAVNLGLAAQAGSDAETARFAFQLAADCKQRSGDMWGEATALIEVAKAAKTLGDETGMRAALNRSQALRMKVGDTLVESDFDGVSAPDESALFMAAGIGPVYLTLGSIASEQGDHLIALPLLNDALIAFREQNDQSGIATALERIAVSAIACEDRLLAITSLEEALTLRREGFGSEAARFANILLESLSS